MAIISTLKAGGTGNVANQKTTVNVLKHEIKISDAVSAGMVTTDKVTLFTVPAGTDVEVLAVQVVDADLSLGSGARIDVGDSAADTTFVNNASTLTNGTYLTVATRAKTYGSADSLFVKVTGAAIASQGTIRIVIRLTDVTRRALATQRVYPN